MPYVGKTGLIAHAEVLAGTSNESPIDVEHWDGGPRREDVPTNGSEETVSLHFDFSTAGDNLIL
ncbi:hypothetical protein KXW76_009026, partial [Aspergillus fumigatus]